MLSKYIRKVSIALLACTIVGGISIASYAQGLTASGTEFWLGFFPNDQNAPTNATELYLCSNSEDTAFVTLGGKTTAYPLKANSVATIDLNGGGITNMAESPSNNSVHIQTHSPITVFGYFDAYGDGTGGSPDGYLGLPVSGLGTEYYTINYTEEEPDWNGDNAEFLIIAAYDSTTVTITTTSHTQNSSGELSHYPGDTWSVMLMQGQSYLVQSSGQYPDFDDLTGSHVLSSKPVGLLSGHEIAEIPLTMSSADYLIEMVPSVDTWGTQYFEMPMAGRTVCGDYIRILSGDDGNQITANGTLISTLNAGQWMEVNTVTTPQVYASSNGKRFLVAQYSYSNHYNNDPAEADPFLVLLTPLEEFENRILFRTPPPAQGISFTNYLTILAPLDSMPLITINGMPATSYISAGEATFAGTNPPIEALRVKLPDGSNSYLATSSVRFGMYQYGISDYEGYGWPAGIALSRYSEELTPLAEISSNSNCGDYAVKLSESSLSPQLSITNSYIAQVAFITQSGDPRWSKPSYNYAFLIDSAFQPGDSIATFTLTMIDPSKPAYAAVWAVNYAGKDTVFEYSNAYGTSNAVNLLSDSNTTNLSVTPGTKIDVYLTSENLGSVNLPITALDVIVETDGDAISSDEITGMNGWTVTPTNLNSGQIQLHCVPSASSTLAPGEKIADMSFNTYLSKSTNPTIQLSSVQLDSGTINVSPCGVTSFSVQYTGCGDSTLSSFIATGEIRVSIATSPNPAHGFVTVTTSTPTGTNAKLKLYNALGECINSFDVNSGAGQTLTIPGLSSGIYFLRLDSPDGLTATQEFVVEK